MNNIKTNEVISLLKESSQNGSTKDVAEKLVVFSEKVCRLYFDELTRGSLVEIDIVESIINDFISVNTDTSSERFYVKQYATMVIKVIFNENLSVITGAEYFLLSRTTQSNNGFSQGKNVASYIFPEKIHCSKCGNIYDFRELDVKERHKCPKCKNAAFGCHEKMRVDFVQLREYIFHLQNQHY